MSAPSEATSPVTNQCVSTHCLIDPRSARLNWAHLPELSPSYPTHWIRAGSDAQRLATELLHLMHSDSEASARLGSSPNWYSALDQELIGGRPFWYRYRIHLHAMCRSRLVQPIDGKLVVHMDLNGALGTPNISLPITEWLRAQVILRDGLVCKICGQPITEAQRFEIDHILPIIDGGLNLPENLRITHRYCNRSRPKSPSKRTLARLRLLGVRR